MITCNTANDLIDIAGLCNGKDILFVAANDATTPAIVGTNNWLQLNVTETLRIPCQKPDVEEINSVTVNAEIMRKQVIVTPSTPTAASENLEGKILTGRKLIVEGEVCLKVVYTACDEEQSVHSAHFYVPFSAYIVIPVSVTLPSGDVKDSLYINYLVNECIEDLYIRKHGCREFYTNATILLQAVPATSCQ